MKKVTLSPKITIDFPYIQKANDYHEFEFIQDEHESLLGRKIKYRELDCVGYNYWAVFYIDENELNVYDVKELLRNEGRTEIQIEKLTKDLVL